MHRRGATPVAKIRAGIPAAVFVNENDTEPYCELAVTV